MRHNPRTEAIVSILSRKRSVKVQELKERLGVSEVTIRKDLDLLEGEGIIQRTHGGAVMAQDYAGMRPIAAREGASGAEKEAIARAARALVTEGETIYIDAGTTCHMLASELRDFELRVVTNSLDVVNELADAENILLHVLGGSYRREARSFIGPNAVGELENININTCFIGATGFLEDGSFSSQNTIEAHLKRQALKVSRRRVILADATKYGVSAFSIFARADEVDILVTDPRFTDASKLEAKGIEVIVAPLQQLAVLGEARSESAIGSAASGRMEK